MITLLFFILKPSHIDKRYTSLISRFKVANKEIKNLYESNDSIKTTEPSYSDYGLYVKLQLTQEQTKNYHLDTIHQLFKDKLIEKFIITSSDEPMYQLKTCFNLKCNKRTKNKTKYIHYLSKNNVYFVDSPTVRIIEKESIENWTYYIVRNRK